ncbi:MAG: sugar phosphate nucleotidyltransferase [Anaerolineae bacterium]|nr:sugar phosphate nucleotidyltransferase [Thermoflexales bacterium]MDW8395228.1 sugar phosphate nucleotidyltransferase [Anaerolineae bacterium]
MNVIIPLAGFGTRLRPHTYSKPKPLVSVAGKPVLGHILDTVVAHPDLEKVVFVVGYLGEQIEQYVKNAYPNLRGEYVEQKELNGQAPAILLAREKVSGPTLIIFVDTLADADLSALSCSQCDGLIFVKEVEDPRRFGVVQLDAEGYITRFVEKPATTENRLAVIGMYYVRDIAALMDACEELMRRGIKIKNEYFLADAFNIMIERGAKLRPQPVQVWLDCGTSQTVLETNRYLLAHGHDNSAQWAGCPGVVVIPPVHIHPKARIVNSVIGPNASIGEGCLIENSVVRESVIESGAEIIDHVMANSLIGRDAVLRGRPRRFNVGDSSVVDFDGNGS